MKTKATITTLLCCTLLILTGCGGEQDIKVTTSVEGTTKQVASGTAISGQAIATEELPQFRAKTLEELVVTLRVNEIGEHWYQATLTIHNEGYEILRDLEFVLEMENKILALEGADIVSRKKNAYTIRANQEKSILPCRENVSFEMEVYYEDEIIPPGICYESTYLETVPSKDVEIRCEGERKDGFRAEGVIYVTNVSDRVIKNWQLEMYSSFEIAMLDNATILEQYNTSDHYDYALLTGKAENEDLEPGETVEIPFEGKRMATVSYVKSNIEMYESVPQNYLAIKKKFKKKH